MMQNEFTQVTSISTVHQPMYIMTDTFHVLISMQEHDDQQQRPCYLFYQIKLISSIQLFVDADALYVGRNS
jgi:hypothetical protein